MRTIAITHPEQPEPVVVVSGWDRADRAEWALRPTVLRPAVLGTVVRAVIGALRPRRSGSAGATAEFGSRQWHPRPTLHQ